MFAFNLRPEVVSRTGMTFEEQFNNFFCRAFSRIYTPPSFSLNLFQFTPLPVRNYTKQPIK